MGRIAIAWMVTFAGMVAAAPPLPDEHILATAPIDRSDAGLLDFLRKRSRPPTDAKIVKPLVDKLASTKKDEVDMAMRELVALGPSSAGALRDALKTTD